tara:strand:- start:191 stop:445 length:255 start_codon:yes stop_codon:yes gene_type:complete
MKKDKKEEMQLANPKGKTVEELKDIVQNLQAQLSEHQKLANSHQTMATKAQGALEVMLQMIPREEVNKMIAQEKAEKEMEENES